MVDQGTKFYSNIQKICLDNNETSIYLAYSESKSIIAERFLRNLWSKIYRKMTTYDSNSYFDYLKKLQDEYNDTYYHHSLGKQPIYSKYFR